MGQPHPVMNPSQRIDRPRAVRDAARLMYAGAALSAILIIVTLASVGSIKSGIVAGHPGYTAAEQRSAEASAVLTVMFAGVVGVCLWLWLAWATSGGRNWARILAAMFFVFITIDLSLAGAGVHAPAPLIVGGLGWLAGLGAVVLLFRKESGRYFTQRPPAARSGRPAGQRS